MLSSTPYTSTEPLQREREREREREKGAEINEYQYDVLIYEAYSSFPKASNLYL